MEKRTRSINNLELRTEGDNRALEGYAAVFNEETDLGHFREVIKPGAFSEALASDGLDVKANFNHDNSAIIGRKKAGRSNNTLELEEDSKGLKFRIEPLPDTQLVDDLIENIKLGNVEDCSFAFEVGEENFSRDQDGKDLREIEEVKKLHDISIVAAPAYEDVTKVEVNQRALDKLQALRKINLKRKRLDLKKLR